ncbi:hypothetical protein AB0J82_20940 [Asanoa sp. NPDC049518]|uniref:hypothetical protein n=1 Tax=unclassified Asanoa TaxID=2685164 RepID=UPI003435EA15
MELWTLIGGPAVALFSVWMGASLSSRGQLRAWQRQQAERDRGERFAAYADLVTATRRYIAYVTGPDADVETIDHPDGDHRVPLFRGEGAVYKNNMEAAAAKLWLLTQSQATANEAHRLGRAARRIAAAAVDGVQAPETMNDKLIKYFAIELGFVNQARRELGLSLEILNPHDERAELP